MNNIRLVFSVLVLFLSFVMVANGYVLFGMYALMGAFTYFIYTLATYDTLFDSTLPVHHVTASEFYRNERDKKVEHRKKTIADLPKNKFRQHRQYRHQYVPAIAAGAAVATIVGSSDDDDVFFASDDSMMEFDLTDIDSQHIEGTYINPATGEPMIGGIGGVDTSGNPFGVDLNHSDFETFMDNDIFESSAFDDSYNSIDDSWSSSFDDDISSTFDDSF